jgi:hypothetical protein
VDEELLDRLTLAAVWLAVGSRDGLELTTAAADALVGGFDSPSLRELGGLHRSTDVRELRDVAAAALTELGRPFPQLDGDEGKLLVLRELCRRYRGNQLSARELTRWCHSYIGHEGAIEAQDLVTLADELDDLDGGVVYRATLAETHRAIDEAVDRFLSR